MNEDKQPRKLAHGLATLVAQRAKVSRATVSAVLNNRGGVAQATVLRVLSAAQAVQRGFQRNTNKASALLAGLKS